MTQEDIDRTLNFSKNALVMTYANMVGIRDTDNTVHIIKCDPEPKLVGTTMTRQDWNNYPIRDKMPNVKPTRTVLQKKEVR